MAGAKIIEDKMKIERMDREVWTEKEEYKIIEETIERLRVWGFLSWREFIIVQHKLKTLRPN